MALIVAMEQWDLNGYKYVDRFDKWGDSKKEVRRSWVILDSTLYEAPTLNWPCVMFQHQGGGLIST